MPRAKRAPEEAAAASEGKRSRGAGPEKDEPSDSEEPQLELVLDCQDRIAGIGPLPKLLEQPLGFNSWLECLEPEACRLMMEAVAQNPGGVFRVKSREVSDEEDSEEEEAEDDHDEGKDTYSEGCTYFIRGTEQPQNLFEEAAQQVLFQHISGMETEGKATGAEWWVVVCEDASSDDVALHFDKDYTAEEAYGVNVYPLLGTVTYLTPAHGAATVITNRRLLNKQDESKLDRGAGGCMLAVEPCSAVVSYPIGGKHITFDGRMLHCAAAELKHTGKQCAREQHQPTSRVTLLVNIWVGWEPLGADRFPEEFNSVLPRPQSRNLWCWGQPNLPLDHAQFGGADQSKVERGWVYLENAAGARNISDSEDDEEVEDGEMAQDAVGLRGEFIVRGLKEQVSSVFYEESSSQIQVGHPTFLGRGKG